jgi:PAS domain S-box-containing protein
MSTTAINVDSRERAPPAEQGALDLALNPQLGQEKPIAASTSALATPANEQLDLATVLKVFEEISGETVQEKFVDRFMRAAIEHTGADRGSLIVPEGDELCIAAEATTHEGNVAVNVGGVHPPHALPNSIFRHVMRTQESVLLDDASAQNMFSGDQYLHANTARSVLCLPLSNRGKLVGLLYIENNRAPRVFASARITLMKLLASQAAISLENFGLHRDLTQRKRAEVARSESEALWRATFDANPTMYFMVDPYGRIAAVNAFGAEQLGYTASDLIGRALLEVYYVSDREPVRKHVDECFHQAGRIVHWEARKVRKDGTTLWVRESANAVLMTDRPMLLIACEDIGEHKRVEQSLRQSEAYLAETQRLTHTGSWVLNPVTGQIIYWSEEMSRIMDACRDLPTYEEMARFIHPDDSIRTSEAVQNAFRDKAEMVLDYRHLMADGTVRYFHTIGHPVLDKTGALVEYVGTSVDVTERRRAEQRLLVQYRVTRILADAATLAEVTPKVLQAMCECLGWDLGAVWRIDPKARVLRCAELWRTSSVEAEQFEGVTRKSTFRSGSGLPGRVWETRAPAYIPDVGHDVAFSRVDIAARQVLRAAIAFPILLGCEVIGVVGFISRDVSQPDQELLAVLASIGSQIGEFTKRTAAIDELQLRVSMLQNIPVAAWSVMPDGTPDIVNQLWYEYTGQTPEYVNSHPEAWMATLHPEDRDRASRSYWDGIRSGRGFTMEARLLRARDGTYRWHLNRAVPVRDAQGNTLRFVGTSTDVHDWRQAQEALRNTQTEFAHMTRVMTMGELTASIAHEVNQPLGAIVTSAAAGARWLATKPPQMDKARRALERIANDGKRAAEVIRRIRALMKRQAPRKEWLDINEAILEVIALAQYQLRRSDILVETRLANDLPLIRCDRVQLQQVLLNLIINAIEAMSGIKERPRKLTIVSASDGPDTVSIEVRDSGTGLDPEHAPHLFEPFYTTKAEGLGIGLSISRSILEAHGGRLSAAANVPYGTVFLFSLPVNEPAP